MELQFKSSKCCYLASAICEVGNTEVTQEVRLSDGMPDIGRVLTAWGQIIIRSKEWLQDQVIVSGGVMTWILYVPEDGTQPRSVDAWVPFQIKWNHDDVPYDGAVRVNPQLRFVDSRSLSARKIMVRIGVAVMGEACYKTEAEMYAPAELPDDIQTLCNTYPLRLPVEMGEKTFLIDVDLSAPIECERILSYTITPMLSEKRIAGDKVVIRGAAILHLLYRCSENRICATDLEVPISQYAQLENAYGTDATSDIQLAVTSLELDQTDDNQLRLKCGMVAQYMINDRILAAITEDAYSTKRVIALMQEVLSFPAMLEQRTEMIPIHHQFPGICGDPVDVRVFSEFPRCARTGDRVILDLSAVLQVLYYAEDGSLQTANGRWDGNFQLDADPNCQFVVNVHPCQHMQVSAGTSDFNLIGKYQIQLNTTSVQGLMMVVGLEMGELTEINAIRPSLILCRPEGETLWSIAKRCGSTVVDIQRVNDLQAEPLDNRMLLIPVI